MQELIINALRARQFTRAMSTRQWEEFSEWLRGEAIPEGGAVLQFPTDDGRFGVAIFRLTDIGDGICWISRPRFRLPDAETPPGGVPPLPSDAGRLPVYVLRAPDVAEEWQAVPPRRHVSAKVRRGQ